MRSLLPFVGAVAVAYGVLCAWVFFTQRGQIYFPTPVSEAPGAQALWVESQGERLKVWVAERADSRAFLYFGGNAADAAGNIELFAEAFPEHPLYLVNYRGYGGSSGRPSEAGLVADPLVVFDHVQARHEDVAVMGRSLGTGVAVQLAAAPVGRAPRARGDDGGRRASCRCRSREGLARGGPTTMSGRVKRTNGR
jgi:fermentation-respiration switch protein FrsA (DUF1100 family)